LNPKDNTKTMVRVPLRNEADRKLMKPFDAADRGGARLPTGATNVWNDPNFIGMPHMDSKGRIWFHAQTRPTFPIIARRAPGIPLRRIFRCRTMGSPGHG
jgi:hypothetical protein